MESSPAECEKLRAALGPLISGEVFRFEGSVEAARSRLAELKLLAEARLSGALEFSGWSLARLASGALSCVALLGALQGQIQGGNKVPLAAWLSALGLCAGLTWLCSRQQRKRNRAFLDAWGDWPPAAGHRLSVAAAALAPLAGGLEVTLLVDLGHSQREDALVGEPGPRDGLDLVSVYETTQLELSCALGPDRPLELSLRLHEELRVGKRDAGSALRKVKQKSSVEAKLGVPLAAPEPRAAPEAVALPEVVAGQIRAALGELPAGVKLKDPEVAAEWVRFRLSTWDRWTYPGLKTAPAAVRVGSLLERITSAFVAGSSGKTPEPC